MADIDPGEHDVSELGPMLREVDDADELRAILEAERAGEDRPAVITVIESRIEKLEEDAGGADGEFDLDSMSAADVGNAIRDVDDPDRLRDLLEREEAGRDRDPVARLIRRRIDSLEGDDEEEDGEGAEPATPEERHPDLDHPTADKQYVSDLTDGTYRDMWVYCETQAGDLLDVSLEMLGKARELMDGYNEAYAGADGAGADGAGDGGDEGGPEEVVAVLIGDDVARHAETCIACGADRVVYHEDGRLARFRHKPYTELFAAMARWTDPDWRAYDEPRYVLFPATNNGRDLSAQVQAELDSGLASDCSGLYVEEAVISNPVKTGSPGSNRTFERVLHMKRPDFSGFEYSTILCLDNPGREFHPQGASVIPGSFDRPDPDPDREGTVVEHDAALPDEWFRVDVTGFDRLDEGVDLTGHDVIVAVGRGIGDDPTRGIELAVDLAEAFDDADVGVSRGIVTGSYDFESHVERYTREERQIGETGQVIAPSVYVAAGISGAIQHKVGCDESETIIAVNTDPDARIRDWSDYFVEGDLFEVLPELTRAVEAGGLDAELVADGGGGRPDGGRTAADPGGEADE